MRETGKGRLPSQKEAFVTKAILSCSASATTAGTLIVSTLFVTNGNKFDAYPCIGVYSHVCHRPILPIWRFLVIDRSIVSKTSGEEPPDLDTIVLLSPKTPTLF